MMTALPPTLLPLALRPIVPIAQPAVAPVASFDAVLTDMVKGPMVADSVSPTDAAFVQAPVEAAGLPEMELCAPFDDGANKLVPISDPGGEHPLVAEPIGAASAPELMVAAQTIAVAAQLATSPARPTVAQELPQLHNFAVGPKQTDAPARPKAVIVAPVFAKPQSDPAQSETMPIEIELVALYASNPPPNHRAAVEPTAFPLPTAAAPTIIQPQIFHELDLARDLAWIGNLAQDIVAASDDRDHLSFRLTPRSLGQLDVDLSRSQEGLRVEMTATTERATQIIAAEQPRLIEELRQFGIKTASADLQTGQHPGSGRGHPPPRGDLPFFNAPTRSNKPTNRPDGRFA